MLVCHGRCQHLVINCPLTMKTLLKIVLGVRRGNSASGKFPHEDGQAPLGSSTAAKLGSISLKCLSPAPLHPCGTTSSTAPGTGSIFPPWLLSAMYQKGSGQLLNKETMQRQGSLPCLSHSVLIPTIANPNWVTHQSRLWVQGEQWAQAGWWVQAGCQETFAGRETPAQASPTPQLENISAAAGFHLPTKFPR